MVKDRSRSRVLLAWVTLLAILSSAAKAADNCEPQLLAEAELKVGSDGKVFMPIRINGHDAWFLLRFTSGLPLLFESAVAQLGMERKAVAPSADIRQGDTRITHYAFLKATEVGTFRLAPRAAAIVPQPVGEVPDQLDGKPVAGIMGSTLVRYVDAEIHLAQRKLKLFKPFRCRSRSPVYWGAPAAELPMRFDISDTLYFTLELDGRKVEASLLDLGSPSTIDVKATREFFGFDDTSPGVEIADDRDGGGGAFHAMSLTGRELDIRNARIRLRHGAANCKLTGNAPVTGAIAYSDCFNLVPFNLGTDLLSQMRIYISKQRQKIFVSVVDAAATSPSGDAVVVPAR